MSHKHFIGTAGWSLPAVMRAEFATEGTMLTRYASRLNSVEINSSFYRSHRLSTYQRWADSVPDDFRFAAKIPKQITHEKRLQAAQDLFRDFMSTCTGLEHKLGVLLVQLPPSLGFDARVSQKFWQLVRDTTAVPVACEPRHATWFSSEAEEQLRRWQIGRVAADPALVDAAREAAGDARVIYYRWHGSPQMYYSAYSARQLRELRLRIDANQQNAEQVWCIFDNTAAGAAAQNALMLQAGFE